MERNENSHRSLYFMNINCVLTIIVDKFLEFCSRFRPAPPGLSFYTGSEETVLFVLVVCFPDYTMASLKFSTVV